MEHGPRRHRDSREPRLRLSRPLRSAIVASALAILLPVSAAGITETLEIAVNGTVRTVRLHVPADAQDAAPLPAVVAFHGSAWNGIAMEQATGFSDLAERERFLAVYPDGTGPADVRSWNAGACCSFALERDVDDVAFVDELLDRLIAAYSVDPARIYATGFSNGGMFAYRLAIERPERFAAIAVVAGAMFPSQRTPGVPVPVLHIHGTSDAVVPYRGGWGSLSLLSGKTEPSLSAVDAVALWIANNGCDAGSSVARSERNARIETVASCEDDTEVVLITLLEGTHDWPVIERDPSDFLVTEDALDLYAGLAGTTDADIPWELFEIGLDATTAIWEFFERHVRR